MSGSAPEPRPSDYEISMPPELEPGAYANFLSVWHTPYEFTLDFCSTQAPVVPDDDEEPIHIVCRATARVKIPATLVFDVIRILNEAMTRYERGFGEITRPHPKGTE